MNDTTRNKQLVLKLIEGIDRADFSILDTLCSPMLRGHFNGKQLNRAEIETAARQFSQAFTGIKHHTYDVVAEGDRVVICALDEATHTGDFRGIPATGRRVSFEMIATYRIADGKIAEVWELMDTAHLLQQIT
jgi:predicted ester cyclase